jgi:hypothetical protein
MESKEQKSVPTIPLGKHTAAALRAEIAEINRLAEVLALQQETLNARVVANSRYADGIMADAGFKPEDYPKYKIEDQPNSRPAR